MDHAREHGSRQWLRDETIEGDCGLETAFTLDDDLVADSNVFELQAFALIGNDLVFVAHDQSRGNRVERGVELVRLQDDGVL